MHRNLSGTFNGLDSMTAINEPLSGKYIKSFAHYTIKERLPVILTSVVDGLVRHKEELTNFKDVAEADLKTCLGKLSKLKNEVQTNKKFTDLTTKGEDVTLWNDYLAMQIKDSDPACWFESSWLYSECYMYRRLYAIFEESETLKNCDYFYYQKIEAIEKSLPDIKNLARCALDILANCKQKDKEHFQSLLRLALWGNRCDLSISKIVTGSTNQLSLNCIRSLDSFLLHDDSRNVFNYLSDSSSSEFILDYVVDNSGFELFCDLCFCDFMCTAPYVTKIRFHVKKFPWYVSDATPNDFKYLFEKLKQVGMEELVERWEQYMTNKKWIIEDEAYWTTPFHFGDMMNRDPQLYQKLCEANLIIFKGDLNYRKLLRDINWKHSEKLEVVLGKFKPSNILALRTIKSDLICGLVHGRCKDLPADLKWMRTGEYAVIQFYCMPA